MNSILENTALEKVGKDNAKISVNVNDSAPNKIFKSCVTRPSAIICNSQIHFKNSCRQQPSTFSCAVDCFLELGYVIFYSQISNVSIKSEFFTLVYRCSTFYEVLLNLLELEDNAIANDIEVNLQTICQPVWEFISQKCPSFANRDCNVQFSEIFSSCIFSFLTQEEKAIFMTRYNLKAFCNVCNVYFNIDSPAMVNYISAHDLENLTDLNDWPNLLDPLTRNKYLQCSCELLCQASIERTKTLFG